MTLPAGGARATPQRMPLGTPIDVESRDHRVRRTASGRCACVRRSWGDGPARRRARRGTQRLSGRRLVVRRRRRSGTSTSSTRCTGACSLVDRRTEPTAASRPHRSRRHDRRHRGRTDAERCTCSRPSAPITDRVLRAFDPSGEARGAMEIGERTASRGAHRAGRARSSCSSRQANGFPCRSMRTRPPCPRRPPSANLDEPFPEEARSSCFARHRRSGLLSSARTEHDERGA